MNTAFCFDLDGTITTEEMLPILAKELELYEEFTLLTELTMQGIIPFDVSFKLRIKLLSAIPVRKVKSILSKVALSDKIIDFIKNNKDRCFIITGNLDCYVEDIVSEIGCQVYSSKSTVTNDFVVSVNYIMNKSYPVNVIREKGFNKIVAIGDGSNDIPMFEQSDVGISYFASKPPHESIIRHSNVIVFDEDSLCKILKML